MVFYRKYRPQTIEDLDSKEVRELLSSVLSSRDIAHAFLFTGPKGLGKTSTARIVAKAVNCLAKRDLASPDENSKINPSTSSGQKSKTQVKNQNLGNEKVNDQRLMTKDQIEPCNKCHQCISITNGTNIDVLEIDGASNRGIDEVRDLREKVRLAPAGASKKVYIIDEVHMLTQEAFNALLKTLEEPPSHVIFILCTTEPHKVPATIASRCFHIAFKKASLSELVRSLKRITEKEKLNTDNEALDFIASLSDGSFRDGVKILEEMKLVSEGKKITKELVGQKYQISNIKYQILQMIESLQERNAKKGLQLVAKLVEKGVDMKYFLEQLVSELHEMLLVEVGVDGSPKLGVRSLKLSIEEIKELVELLSRAHGELKYAVLPQLPLELVVVEWGLVKSGSPRPLNDSSSARGPTNDGAEVANENFLVRNAKKGLLSNSTKNPASAHNENFIGSPRSKNPRETDNFWQELINRVKSYNHSIAGVLRGCSLKSCDNKEIVIETGFKFHKERLDERRAMEILKRVCKEVSGKTIGVSVLLKEKKGVNHNV